jgi:hypothetical protein
MELLQGVARMHLALGKKGQFDENTTDSVMFHSTDKLNHRFTSTNLGVQD